MIVRADTQPVKISSCGCVTPFGDAADTLDALLQGKRALQPTPVAGAQGGDLVPIALMSGRGLDESSPPSWTEPLMRMLARLETRKWGSARYPVFVTSSNFGVGSLHAYRMNGGTGHLAYGSPSACIEWLRHELGWGHNIATFSHACVSAHLGLVQAERMVEAGLAEQALVVSFDFVSPFVAGGFHALKILNVDFPAPYEDRPTGSIGLGDGAAFAVLSRGGDGFRILGQSLFNEMHHFTANKPDGSGFAACLAPILEQAKGRRVWVKGHGTGTLEAGRLEATSLATAFPDSPLTGWKGSLGHTLGSCGLVELAIATEAIRQGSSPAVVGSGAPAFAANVALEAFSLDKLDTVLCTSNAFGGAHATLLLAHD